MIKRIGSSIMVSLMVMAAIVAILLSVLTDSGLLSSHHPLQEATQGQIRVACVGDSLTYGFGIPDHDRSCYPAQLQAMLGEGYCVNNYGYSGRTVSPDADRPYTKEALYDESVAFAPNVVILMLGSNDTKPFNWVSDEHYLQCYREIAESYLKLDSVETLVLMAPTPVFAVKGVVPYHINQAKIEDLPHLAYTLYQELKWDYPEKMRFVDLHPLFEDRPDLFSDGAHPTKEGAEIIARQVYLSIAQNN